MSVEAAKGAADLGVLLLGILVAGSQMACSNFLTRQGWRARHVPAYARVAGQMTAPGIRFKIFSIGALSPPSSTT